MSRKSEFYHIVYRQRVRRGTAIQIIEKYDPVETTARVYHVDPPTPDGMVTKEAEKKTAKKPKTGTETTYYQRWYYTSESEYCGQTQHSL